MAITLDGTSGITTPDVNSDGLTVDTTTLVVDEANNRVGIGTASPSADFEIASTQPKIKLTDTDGGISDVVNVGGNLFIRSDTDNTQATSHIRFDVDGSERARIDSSGNLLVGTTSWNSSSNGIAIQPQGRILLTSNTDFQLECYGGTSARIAFYSSAGGGTRVGTIESTTTSTSYNTSSDYRLKEDWVAVTDASTRVNALKPVNFAWKVDGKRVDGFLAHELAEVVPEAVTGEKDAVDDEGNPVYQGIDQSKLVPLLTAALQEALTKIETLEARVAALEAA